MAWTLRVLVLTPDRPHEWGEGRLNLTDLTVTIGAETVPGAKIRAICHKRGHYDRDDEIVLAASNGHARDVPVAVDVNCGWVVLHGVIVGRPRAELEAIWPEWQAR